MQAQVDMLNEKYESQIEEAENSGTHFAEIGKDLSTISIEGEPENSFNAANVVDETEKNKYRYYDISTLESLDLTDIEIEFLVNIKDRKVIAIGGFEFSGVKYYTLEQIKESPQVGGLDRGEVTIGSITSDRDASSGYIINIENIKCSKYVKKYTIKYKKSTEDTYKTLDSNIVDEDYSFKVNSEGRYYIQIIDAAGNIKETNIAIGDVPAEIPEVSDKTAFSRQWGVIEIEFLEGTSYYTTDIPNEPNMTDDMKKVYWEDGEEKVEGESEDFDKNKWYEYVAQTGSTEAGGTSHWANAKTSDGSYWVWIPRYAYRIVYFDTETNRDEYRKDNTQTEGIIGYSDARGLVDTEGKTPSDLQEPVTSISVGTNKLRPHPAFEDGSSTGFTQGEWDSKLEGIWVAKYEMSQSGTTIKSIPGVSSYRNIKIGDMYTKSYDYDRNKESHLMKNSEWGVVAYLTESKYGRNGTAVSRNTNFCYTAGASGATPTTNPLQSTTGNEYGIFDTVGGAWEDVAGYVADSSQSYGNSFASIDNTTNNKTESTKYATVYKMANSNIYTENYRININKVLGDATTEISTSGTGTNSWHSASSSFVGGSSYSPFFIRGGGYFNTNAGSFYFISGTGNGYNSDSSFRVCLTIK